MTFDPLTIGYAVGAALVAVPVILCLGSLLFKRKFDYRGKHVLVTGGSSGIGLEVAREYLRKGANVSIMARDKKKLDTAKLELVGDSKALENQLCLVSGDTGSSLKAVEEALAPCIKKYGDVDVLVNCAGTSVAGAFDELDIGDFERMLKVLKHSAIDNAIVFVVMPLFLNLQLYCRSMCWDLCIRPELCCQE